MKSARGKVKLGINKNAAKTHHQKNDVNFGTTSDYNSAQVYQPNLLFF